MAGKPGAARAVVRALHAVKGLPWWRVTEGRGRAGEGGRREQARRLAREGVEVEGRRVARRDEHRSATAARSSTAGVARTARAVIARR